jgi:hypothetical protein
MTDSVAVFEPGFRVLDTNGNPVNNAKIKFREVGPGATKVVYADAGLTVALGTIVRTRSDGFPVVSVGSSTTVLIYVGNTNYNIEITDEFDVPIFPAKDVVKGALDTSGFLPVGSTSVLVKPVITKAVPFTLALADKGKLYDCIATGGTFTGTLPDPVTVGDGWNVTIRNGGTANLVSLSSPANINTPMGDVTAFSLRVGEAVEIVSNGATFKVDGYVPPLITAGTGIILINSRVAAAPGAPVAGSRYIVTAAFSTFAIGDIIEASGQGTFFKITPPANSGWLAYVQTESAIYQYRSTAWVCLQATQAQAEAGTDNNAFMTALRTRQAIPARAYAEYSANADLTATIPLDDTIPQSTEGTEILTATITPKSVNSRIRATISGFGCTSTIKTIILGLFQDAIANALFAHSIISTTGDNPFPIACVFEYPPATTSAITLRVRIGMDVPATLRMNGFSGSRKFGGVAKATLTLEEVYP